MADSTDIRVELATLKQEIENSKDIQGRLDTAIDKLTDVSTCVKSMLAVQEDKIQRAEQTDEVIFTKLREQKSLGRKVRGFDKYKWEQVCRDYVYEGNYAKFTQNQDLKDELLTYGDREIVEASPEDAIWGIGMHERHPDILDKSKWQGTNWLGEAIMRVRETLKEEKVLA